MAPQRQELAPQQTKNIRMRWNLFVVMDIVKISFYVFKDAV